MSHDALYKANRVQEGDDAFWCLEVSWTRPLFNDRIDTECIVYLNEDEHQLRGGRFSKFVHSALEFSTEVLIRSPAEWSLDDHRKRVGDLFRTANSLGPWNFLPIEFDSDIDDDLVETFEFTFSNPLHAIEFRLRTL